MDGNIFELIYQIFMGLFFILLAISLFKDSVGFATIRAVINLTMLVICIFSGNRNDLTSAALLVILAAIVILIENHKQNRLKNQEGK